MELFKLRYNLYKYLIKNNFKFKNSLNSLNVFKNLIYITIIFFILIFLFGFEYINFFIIFFIILLIILIYNIEKILIKLDEILSNKFFQNYSNYYNTLNKIFNINYDNINDINGIINSPDISSSVTNIEMTYGGVGYTPDTEYTITIIQPATEAKAEVRVTAKIKALRNGSLSGEIYDLTSETGITNLDIIPTITLGSSPSAVTTSAPAIFKYYVSNQLTMTNIKEYSLSYMNMYENIKKKIGFIDNVLNEDIDEHINLIKKENDLLKYIDVYDNKYEFLKKFIILNEDKNEKLFNIFGNNPITDFIDIMNDKTILINLENLEKYKDNNNIKDKYSRFMNELELKDLNFLENPNLNNNEKILKTIENFDIIFYYLLIIIIIIFTILLHIFFIKLY
jgi:hypothetical protein